MKIDILANRHKYKLVPASSVWGVEPVWIKTIQHRDYPGWVLKKFAAIRYGDNLTGEDEGVNMIEMMFYGKSPDGRWFQSMTMMTGALWDDEDIPLGKIVKDMIFESMETLGAQSNAGD